MSNYPALIPKRTHPEIWLARLGWLCTAMAMGAQAFFGVMLMDFYLFQNLDTTARALLDLLFFITIEESKRRVVTHHSEENFMGLARINWGHLLRPWHWKFSEVAWQLSYNIPLTFAGTQVFVAITGMSLDDEVGAAFLLKSYDIDALTAIANVVGSRAFQIVFMTAATMANLLFWPKINEMAYHRVKYLLRWLIEADHFKQEKALIVSNTENLRRTLKSKYENPSILFAETKLLASADAYLTQFRQVANTTGSVEENTRNSPNQSSNGDLTTVQPHRLLAVFALATTTIGAIGFWNIYELGGVPTIQKISDILVGEKKTGYDSFAPVASVLSYLAIIALVIGLIPSLVFELRRFRRSQELGYTRVSSNFGWTANLIKATIICALGTTPNIYQANTLLKESIGFVVCAALGSFLIEFQAAHQRCQPFNAGTEHWYTELLAYIKDFFAWMFCGKCWGRTNACATDETARYVQKADQALIHLVDDPSAINVFAENTSGDRSIYLSWMGKFLNTRATQLPPDSDRRGLLTNADSQDYGSTPPVSRTASNDSSATPSTLASEWLSHDALSIEATPVTSPTQAKPSSLGKTTWAPAAAPTPKRPGSTPLNNVLPDATEMHTLRSASTPPSSSSRTSPKVGSGFKSSSGSESTSPLKPNPQETSFIDLPAYTGRRTPRTTSPLNASSGVRLRGRSSSRASGTSSPPKLGRLAEASEASEFSNSGPISTSLPKPKPSLKRPPGSKDKATPKADEPMGFSDENPRNLRQPSSSAS